MPKFDQPSGVRMHVCTGAVLLWVRIRFAAPPADWLLPAM